MNSALGSGGANGVVVATALLMLLGLLAAGCGGDNDESVSIDRAVEASVEASERVAGVLGVDSSSRQTFTKPCSFGPGDGPRGAQSFFVTEVDSTRADELLEGVIADFEETTSISSLDSGTYSDVDGQQLTIFAEVGEQEAEVRVRITVDDVVEVNAVAGCD